MATEVLKLVNLSFAYKKDNEIFSNINFSLFEGEILGILGPSGTGKSSLLRLITGLEKPSEGEIYYFGKEISGLSVVVELEELNGRNKFKFPVESNLKL